MESKLFEMIDTTNGKFFIYEIGESVFWEVYHIHELRGIMFHDLENARSYIRATERTTRANWTALKQQCFIEGQLA